MEVHFLGTAGGVPSPARSLPCTALKRNGSVMLFDCGEGSQRQLMMSPLSMMAVDCILISHHHGDHVTGVPGLLQTMSLFSRQRPLRVFGPTGTVAMMDRRFSNHDAEPCYKVEVRDLAPGDSFESDGMTVLAVGTDHSIPSLGYVLREPPRSGRFDADAARGLGVAEGPLFSDLQNGVAVEIEGRVVSPEEVMGPPRRGRSFSYSGDTRPCVAFIEASRGVDLMVHEATFADDSIDRAAESGHSTARQAAEVAKQAEVSTLVLTHISPRIDDALTLEREASEVIGTRNVVVAQDFDSLRIEYPE